MGMTVGFFGEPLSRGERPKGAGLSSRKASLKAVITYYNIYIYVLQ